MDTAISLHIPPTVKTQSAKICLNFNGGGGGRVFWTKFQNRGVLRNWVKNSGSLACLCITDSLSLIRRGKEIILQEVTLNSCKVRLNIEKLRKLEFWNFMSFSSFFWVFQRVVESEIKKIILVKCSLGEVRFNPCEIDARWDWATKVIVHSLIFSFIYRTALWGE